MDTSTVKKEEIPKISTLSRLFKLYHLARPKSVEQAAIGYNILRCLEGKEIIEYTE